MENVKLATRKPRLMGKYGILFTGSRLDVQPGESLPERKNFWYAFTRDQHSTLKTE